MEEPSCSQDSTGRAADALAANASQPPHGMPPLLSAVPPEDSRAPEPPPNIGFAVAGMVFAICGFSMCILPFALVPALTGLCLSIYCLAKGLPGKGMATAGVVLGSIGTIASGVVLVGVAAAVAGFMGMGGLEEDWSKWEGVAAPDFTVTDVDGNPFRLSEMRGKAVVVDRFATWCGPCKMLAKHLDELVKANPDVVVISVSDELEALVSKHAKKEKHAYRTAAAESLPSPYGDISAYPTLFFIDPNGVITEVATGYMPLEELKDKVSVVFEGTVKASPSDEEEE